MGHPPENRWGLLISGIASAVLGVIVLFNIVTATFTLLGVLLGVQVLLDERARETGEPAGQLAARELEVERIRSALHRAQELSDDAAAALEAAAV